MFGPPCAPNTASAEENPVVGSWQQVDDEETFVRFEPTRFSVWQQGQFMVGKIRKWEAETAVVALGGRDVVLTFKVDGDSLTLKPELPGEEPDRYRRLKEVPEQLKPMVFGAAADLPQDRLKEIKAELNKRLQEDQAVRTDPSRSHEMHRVDVDNTAYVKGLVQEIGWIDASRFGAEASNAAFLIVQHSGDLRLMMASLPMIEMDVKAGKIGAEAFVLLYDRVQLMIGEKQRYGSQAVIKNGKAVVLPLEDPEKVDEYRKEMGLPPLAEYLSVLEKLYAPKEKPGKGD